MPEDTGKTDNSGNALRLLIESDYRPFMDEWEIAALLEAFSMGSGPQSVLEWGSGNSTLYFSCRLPRGSRWDAIEHNRDWALQVIRLINRVGLEGVHLHYVGNSGPFRDGFEDGDYSSFPEYILFPLKMQRRFDFILVDGRARVECMLAAWELLNDGGLIILHDAERTQYDAGIPEKAQQLRMTNPFLPEGKSVLFLARDAAPLVELAVRLDRLLPETILLAATTPNSALTRRSARAMRLFAEALDARGEAATAMGLLWQAIELDPDSPDACISLGQMLVRAGQHDQALEVYRLAREIDPTQRAIPIHAASAALARGRADEARQWLAAYLDGHEDAEVRALLDKLPGGSAPSTPAPAPTPLGIGSDYGGWFVLPDLLDRDSIVYSVGIGEDISFDLGLIERFGVEVHAFDPTPKSIAWLKNQALPAGFHAYPLGLMDYDGTAQFFLPANPDHVSCSTFTSSHLSSRDIQVQVRRLPSLMRELGHDRVDLLKMDIEGSEYAVIDDLLASGLRPRQLLVEFHHRFESIGPDRTRAAIQSLQQAGYELFHQKNNFQEVSFVFRGEAPVTLPEAPPATRHAWASRCATVLVAYNRPWHTRQVVEALRRHRVANLIVLCDAPRTPAQAAAVEETRGIIAGIDWTTPRVVLQETNQGLARSVVQGINLALANHDAVILLEDDCVPQTHYFDFVYDCLARYEHDSRVFGISGYSIPLPQNLRESYPYDLYFFPRMGSWGWATWKSRWQTDDRNLARLTLQALEEGIDLEQGGSDIPDSIGDVLKGAVRDTWTLPWLVNVYLHHACYIYPTQSHIDNIGFDGTGVHCGKTDKYRTELATRSAHRFPESPLFDPAIAAIFKSYYQFASQRRYDDEQLARLARGKSLRILHLCTHDNGGAGNAAYRLHQALRSAGVASSMLVVSKKTQDPDVHAVGSIQAVHARWQSILARYPAHRQDLELFSDALCDIDLAGIDLFREADIVNLHWVAGLVDHARLAPMLAGKPVVWTLHDMNAFTGGCHYTWECEKYLQACGACPQLGSTQEQDASAQGYIRKCQGYEGADIHVVCPSAWLAGEATRSTLLGGRPVQVIPNGFPLEVFQPYPRDFIREKLNIAPGRKVVLFGCDSLLNARKGFAYLLQAMDILARDGSEAPLFCFFGQQPADLHIPGETMALGTIQSPQVLAAVYAMADVFVIPSLQDNLPNVIPESFACGTPVVGFRVGGVPEIIQHESNGYLVEPRDSRGLAAGIRWLLAHADEAMRRRCREFAQEHFSQPGQASAYLALYQQILSAPRPEYRPLAPLPAPVAFHESAAVLVNLGCGQRFHPAWLNYDFTSSHSQVRAANLRQGIPLPDGLADAIYHSHVLQHFPKTEAPGFIVECRRVLKPGGVLRIAIPDLEVIARLYLHYLERADAGDPVAEERYDWMLMELLDQLVRNRPGGSMLDWWIAPDLKARDFIIERTGDEVGRLLDGIRRGGRLALRPEPTDPKVIGSFRLSGEIHQWMYDRFSLRRLLAQTGFVDIRLVAAGESAIPGYAGYGLDSDEQGRVRKPDSLFIEARKPGSEVAALPLPEADARQSCVDGHAALARGDLATAMLAFIDAIQADPANLDALNQLACLSWDQGKNDEAIGLIEHAYAIDPTDHATARNHARMVAAEPALPEAEGSMEAPYKITAVVSTYNSEAFIGECLEDLSRQTIADQIEIFVLDANSPQNERAVVERFQQHHGNIRYLRTPERIGVYAAWNVIAREACGEYLISCSTNDRLAANACEILAGYLDAHPEIALVYGNSFLVDKPHQSFEHHVHSDLYLWPPYSYDLLSRQCLVGPHPMWRRSLHEELGYFDESYKAIGDQDFWLRVGYGHEIWNLAVFTGLYYVSPSALSRDMEVAPNEVRRVHRAHLPKRFQRALSTVTTIPEALSEDAQANFLIIMPVMSGEEALLAGSLETLLAQNHTDWHLAVVSDVEAPDPLLYQHPRVSWHLLEGRGLHVRARDILAIRDVDWVMLAEPGLRFNSRSLAKFAQAAACHPEWQLIYCDDYDTDLNGGIRNPRHKPEFCLDLLRRMPYLDNFMVRCDSLLQAGGIGECVLAENYDIALRVHDQQGSAAIGHLSTMLLGKPWGKRRPFHLDAGKMALVDHYRRTGLSTKAESLSESLLSGPYGKSYELLGGQSGNPDSRSEQTAGSPAASDAVDFYRLWQMGHSYLKRDAQWIAERMDELASQQHFHLVVITLPGREDALANNIKSLGHQFYPDWQLTIVATTSAPDALDGVDSITWRRVPLEALLAEASRALLGVSSDWVGIFEAGDKLAPHALFTFADQAVRHPAWQVMYSDEDQVSSDDIHSAPFFKTDFNLEMLRAAPYAVGGLLLLRHDLFSTLGGFDPARECVEAFDLILRAWERVGHAGIGHVADVLYHRYDAGGHALLDGAAVATAHRAALAAHLTRCGLDAALDDGLLPGTVHVRYSVSGNPLVSVLIPNKNQVEILKRCLTSLVDVTGYSNCEILILDNGSDDEDTITYLGELTALDSTRLRVLSCNEAVNISALYNRGAQEAQGDYLLLLNQDTAVLYSEWLEEMLGIAQQSDVGAVGAKLYFSDGRIQHAGVLLGINEKPADHPFFGCAGDEPGYFGRNQLTQEYSALTAACLLVRRSTYHEVGGMDEDHYKALYNDVDFCLRLCKRGYRNVFTPYARLLREGMASQTGNTDGKSQAVEQVQENNDLEQFFDTWGREIAYDPAYNRNLSTHGTDFLIEIAPALTWDPQWRPRPRIMAHPADRSGCGEYRIISPMRALNDAGRVMGWETGSYLSILGLLRFEPDSVILQRQVDISQILLIEQRYSRYSKAFRVFEIDDLITNIPIQSAHKKHFISQKDLHKRFRRAVAMCDRFIVSTDYLAEQYQGYNGDIVVVPNYIERARWGNLLPPRVRGAKPRVGWAGGSSHDGDLAIIADVVKATAQEVDWVFFGMCPDSIRPYVAEFHNGVVLEEYPAKLASLDLDLAVAPLEDVPFNHGKSHLRLLEYGVLGYPVICTDITPYRGDYPVTRVPNKFKDWVEAIRSHVADRDELARRGDALREYIEARWMLEDHLDVWVKAWLP